MTTSSALAHDSPFISDAPSHTVVVWSMLDDYTRRNVHIQQAGNGLCVPQRTFSIPTLGSAARKER